MEKPNPKSAEAYGQLLQKLNVRMGKIQHTSPLSEEVKNRRIRRLTKIGRKIAQKIIDHPDGYVVRDTLLATARETIVVDVITGDNHGLRMISFFQEH